ncbi:MAG: response regulator transcription factor [Bacteroidota bacterium]
MHKQRLLLVEDDPNLGSILQEYLGVKGYDVTLSRDGEAGLKDFGEGGFAACILDVMMPKKDGFTLARDIRKVDQQTPILFLTAKNMIADKAEGFGLGGDDYLTKPFSMEELLLRINALLRRSGQAQTEASEAEQTAFQIGAFHFDYATRRLAKEGDEGKRVTSREAELLKLLCLHMNDILKREVALKLIWGDDSYFNARSMDVFITKLRKYLKGDERVEIMNVHGMGYKLVVR